MKYLISLIITVTILSYSPKAYSLEKASNKGQLEIEELKNRIEVLEDTNKELARKIEDSNNQFKLYEILLNKYDNSSSSLLAEFAIFIGVFALLFGFIGYFTAYKPAKESKADVDKLLHKLNNNIEKMFFEYLKNNRDKLVSKYIQIILNKDSSELSSALSYLETAKHEKFNTEQLYRMSKIVLDESHPSRHQLATIIINTNHEIVENTCLELLKKMDDKLVIYSIIYFAKFNIHKHDKLVIQYLNKESDKWSNVLASVSLTSEEYLIELFEKNYKDIDNSSVHIIKRTLNFYHLRNHEGDTSKAGLLNKIKATKFGKKHKKGELKCIFEPIKNNFNKN